MLVLEKFEDGGYETAVRFMAPIKDLGSLAELREAIRGRGPRALSGLQAEYEQIKLDPEPSREQVLKKVQLEQSSDSFTCTKGSFSRPAAWLQKALESSRPAVVPAKVRSRLRAVLGIVAMRRGEIENCLECAGPSSCIFPIAAAGPSSKPVRLARSHQVVHGLSGRFSPGPADHLAIEHRLHDARRASR